MENISEILRKHKLWLKDEDGERADLSDAKLSGANLSEANLRRVASGNNSEILTVQTGEWIIVYTPVCMAIGCQQHSLSEWWSFNDEQIADMDKGSLDFWRKWKPILRQIMGLTSDNQAAQAKQEKRNGTTRRKVDKGRKGAP